jgi:N-methylhydantoinase B
LIPDGVYYGESAVDWDGTTPDKQVFVRVKLTVKGDEMTFDYSDSDDQVEFVNAPLGITYACTFQAIFWVFDATIPHNHGATLASAHHRPGRQGRQPHAPSHLRRLRLRLRHTDYRGLQPRAGTGAPRAGHGRLEQAFRL